MRIVVVSIDGVIDKVATFPNDSEKEAIDFAKREWELAELAEPETDDVKVFDEEGFIVWQPEH